MEEDRDYILVKKTQDGDSDAFGELVLKYQKRIYDIAYSFTHNVEDAYDLSQEIFLKAFKAIDRFQDNSAFYTWLYRIAKNAGIDYIRRQKRKNLMSFGDITAMNRLCKEQPQNQPIHQVERDELNEQIKKSISKLPTRQKQVFVLKHYKELKLREIAETLGLSIGTVKAHHFNAVRRLRKNLSNYITGQQYRDTENIASC